MPTLLLCGHGYLGRVVSRGFLAAGWDVTALSRSGDGGEDVPPLPGALTEISRDLSSPGDIAALEVRPDLIVHCASSGRGGPDAYRAVYLNGCRHLLDAFPGVPLLFTSSTSVYAQTDGSEVTEVSPAEPERETGRILRETEDLVLAHGGIVTRLSGLYGPQRSVILEKLLSGQALLEEGGCRYLNQIHRDDAAAAILHLSSIPRSAFRVPRLYNLSDSRPLTQLECHEGLAGIFTLPLPPSGPRDPHRKRGWTHKRVSNAKLRATGWEPRFPCFLDAAAGIAPTLRKPA